MTQEQIKKNILFEDYEILQQLLKAPSVSVAKQRFLRGDKEAVNAMLKIQEHKIMASDPDSGIICNWESLEKALEKKADVGHTHQPADIDNLEASLNNKADALHIHTWDEVTGKPATFLPTPHEHSISEVSGLTQELANKAYTNGYYQYLKAGNATTWNGQSYAGSYTIPDYDGVMILKNNEFYWTPMETFLQGVGIDNYVATDGSNSTGGNWNINYIGSPRLASGGAEAQVFYASGNKEIFWGNPRLQYHRFQGTDENSMLYYATNKQAYGFIWNEFNMPHYRKYGLGVDYRITTPNIDTLTETQFNTILPSTQGTLPFNYGTLLHQTYDANGSEWTQTGIDVGSGNLYFRVKNIGEGIGAWKSVWHTENFNPDSKADTSGSYPALNVGNAEQWSGQKYISSGTSSADLVMVYKEAENAWTWMPKTDFQNWIGLGQLEYAKKDGSNTIGGAWNVDMIISNILGQNIGNNQVFAVTAAGQIYWGNPKVLSHTFEMAAIDAMNVYVPGHGYGKIWNSFTFNPNTKQNKLIAGTNITIDSNNVISTPTAMLPDLSNATHLNEAQAEEFSDKTLAHLDAEIIMYDTGVINLGKKSEAHLFIMVLNGIIAIPDGFHGQRLYIEFRSFTGNSHTLTGNFYNFKNNTNINSIPNAGYMALKRFVWNKNINRWIVVI